MERRLHPVAHALFAALLLGVLLISTVVAAHAAGHGGDLAGTYIATLPDRAEILQLHRDGTAGMTLSDQVTSGAGGFIVSDSFGSWKRSGPRRVSARMANLNFGPPRTRRFSSR